MSGRICKGELGHDIHGKQAIPHDEHHSTILLVARVRAFVQIINPHRTRAVTLLVWAHIVGHRFHGSEFDAAMHFHVREKISIPLIHNKYVTPKSYAIVYLP